MLGIVWHPEAPDPTPHPPPPLKHVVLLHDAGSQCMRGSGILQAGTAHTTPPDNTPFQKRPHRDAPPRIGGRTSQTGAERRLRHMCHLSAVPRVWPTAACSIVLNLQHGRFLVLTHQPPPPRAPTHHAPQPTTVAQPPDQSTSSTRNMHTHPTNSLRAADGVPDRSSRVDDHAAVGVQHLARDVRSVLRRQEHVRGRNLRTPSRAAGRPARAGYQLAPA